ncbi:FecCD family ABC transporter permease [Xanthobacter agilis]|uniref:FecCD family ABC transporter permease n=1 Tax=Xanthobacter agilis TaxID=47492 RepID=UPI003726B97C
MSWGAGRLALVRRMPLVAGTVGLLVLAAGAFAVGAYPVGVSELWAWAAWRLGLGEAPPPVVAAVIENIRGPRILAAMGVGAALATAGAAYQSLFRNPLVSPDILGVSSGAALGAVIGIFLSLPVAGVEAASFVGGLAAVATVYGVAHVVRGHEPLLVLVLAGIVIGTLFSAGISILKVLADPYNQLPAITFWLLGSLAGAGRKELVLLAPALVVGLTPLLLLRWRIDIMTLGEEEARALGVEAGRVRFIVIVAATLLTATAVSVAGIIGWVGLVVPHLARLLVGPAFARAAPVAALGGGAFLLAVDTLARGVSMVEIPLGVLTAVVGTPVFLWLLSTSRKGWG